jgi:hypothetical protein
LSLLHTQTIWCVFYLFDFLVFVFRMWCRVLHYSFRNWVSQIKDICGRIAYLWQWIQMRVKQKIVNSSRTRPLSSLSLLWSLFWFISLLRVDNDVEFVGVAVVTGESQMAQAKSKKCRVPASSASFQRSQKETGFQNRICVCIRCGPDFFPFLSFSLLSTSTR